MQRVLLLLTLLLLAGIVEAQPSFPVVVLGCVEEEDGDPVLAIEVTVENVDAGTERSDVTDEEGCYEVSSGRDFQLVEGDEIRVWLVYDDEEYEEWDQVGDEPIIEVNFVVAEPGFPWFAVGIITMLAIGLAGIFLYLKYHPVDSNNL
jgi:hypothetical protein